MSFFAGIDDPRLNEPIVIHEGKITDAETRRRLFIFGGQAERNPQRMSVDALRELIEKGGACGVHAHQVRAGREEWDQRAFYQSDQVGVSTSQTVRTARPKGS